MNAYIDFTKKKNKRIIRFKKQLYLPHQWDFLTSNKFASALVTGFGGGKTHIFLRKCLWAHINLKNKKGKSNGWVIYPTYALAEELFVDQFKLLLWQNGIKYKYLKSKHVFKTKYGRIRVFQLQKPELMVGSELSWCGFDEFDVEKKDKVVHAYNKAVGRMRGCEFPQLFVVTTPEGFRATHEIFVEQFDKTKCLIQGSTRDNIYGEKGYVERLERTYTPQLVAAYIEGQFVNLTSGSVYPYFDRNKCHTDTIIKDDDHSLFIGQDFNFGGCASTIFVEREGEFHQASEMITRDTQQLIDKVGIKYPGREIFFYPDASGNSESSNASKSDIAMIKNAGFKVIARKANPRITDRVNSVNRAFYQNIVRINTKKCPKTTKAIEQHAYDEKTGKPEKFTKPGSIDDWNDSHGYPVSYRYPVRKPTQQQEDFLL